MSTWVIGLILGKRVIIFSTWMQITCMVGQWANTSQMAGSNRLKSSEKLCISTLAKKQSKSYLLEVDVMYEFHCDYMIPKYCENLRLCSMDTIPWFMTTRWAIYMRALPTMLPPGLMLATTAAVVHFSWEWARKSLAWWKMNWAEGSWPSLLCFPKLYTYEMFGESGDKKCKGIKKCVTPGSQAV